jgi:hypothetical protein
MKYPEKLYVALRDNDWPDETEDQTYYHTTAKIEGHAVLNSSEEIAVYQYAGKIKIVNKTVLAEPDAGTP